MVEFYLPRQYKNNSYCRLCELKLYSCSLTGLDTVNPLSVAIDNRCLIQATSTTNLSQLIRHSAVPITNWRNRFHLNGRSSPFWHPCDATKIRHRYKYERSASNSCRNVSFARKRLPCTATPFLRDSAVIYTRVYHRLITG